MSLVLLGILNSQVDAAGGGGAYDLLETVNVTGSSTYTASFTGLDEYSDYKHLQLRVVSKSLAVNNGGLSTYEMRFNNDSTQSYGTHELYGNGSNVGSGGGANRDSLSRIYAAPRESNTNLFGAAVIDILDFSSSTKNTTIRTLCGTMGSLTPVSSYSLVALTSGFWNNTNPVTQLDFGVNSNGFYAGSRISLYGVK